MKSSMKKIIAICTVCVVLAVGLLSVGLWGYFKDDNRKLTDMQRIEKVLAKTGEKVQTNNKNLVDSYNKTIDDQLNPKDENGMNSFTYQSGNEFHYLDGEDAFSNAISEINSYTEWYVYFEYLYECLDSTFLNKTYDVQTKVGSTIYYRVYAKYTCGYDNIQLIVTTPDEGYNDIDDIVATLYFDEKTLEPTRLEFVDKYTNAHEDYDVPYTYSRYIDFDFVNETFDFTEISMPSSSNVSELKDVEGIDILDKIYDAEFYHVEFKDYSKYFGTYVYAYGDYSEQVTHRKSLGESGFKNFFQTFSEDDQAEFIDKIKTAKFSNLDNFTDNFDIENAVPFEKGDEAMRYGQNKYRIEENRIDDVVYLTVRQIYGIDDGVMSALEAIDKIYNGNYHEFDVCNNLNFVYNDTNYKKDIQIDNKFLTQEDFAAIKNWLENDYDANKYYFEEIKINNELTATISNQEFNISKNYGKENATFLSVYTYSSYWFLEIGQFSSTGFEKFELNFYNESNGAKSLYIHHYLSSKKLSDFVGSEDNYVYVDADLHESFNYSVSNNYQGYFYNKNTNGQYETFGVSSESSQHHYTSSSVTDKIYFDLYDYIDLKN